MAASSWSTDLNDIILEPTTSTGWTALGGGASGLPSSGETDFYIQGSTCMSKAAWTNAVKGFMYTGGGPWTIPTDGVLLAWVIYAPAVASLATKTNGGTRIVIGSSSTAYYSYYYGGSDTLIFDSWIPVGIDPNNATADATTGSPSGTESVFGVVANLPTTAGPTKGNPLGMDALRYGRHTITYLNGDLGNGYNTFALAEAYANDSTRRWGNIELINGAYYVQGFHSFGSSGTAVDFRDSNKTIFIRACAHNLTNDAVSTAYNRFEILNASSNIDWDNIIFQSLGTRSRGTFVHTAGTFDATSCQFVDVNTFSLLSTSVMTDCIFRRTNAITAPGSNLVGSQILTPTVAADTSGLIWDVGTDPDGYLDNMTFSKGTNAHHAIEFGTSSPTTITLRGITFSGFNGSDSQNDSTLHIKRTTGTVTIYIEDGGTTPTYKSAGATVNIISGSVSLTVNVKDSSTGNNIQNARVFTETSDGTGPFPFEDSITITRSGSTATVSHSSHGMTTNDKIVIRGADQNEYNGIQTITYIDANSYSFSVTGTPTTPATGTIICSFVPIEGLTDSSGNITTSRVYSSSQPIKGKVRKSSSAPYYKSAGILGTVNNSTGFEANIQLISDD